MFESLGNTCEDYANFVMMDLGYFILDTVPILVLLVMHRQNFKISPPKQLQITVSSKDGKEFSD